VDGTSAPRHVTSKPGCDVIYYGNDTRSGHFNSRSMSWKPSCNMTFIGRPTDIVHVSLFNYMLRLLVCICQSSAIDELVYYTCLTYKCLTIQWPHHFLLSKIIDWSQYWTQNAQVLRMLSIWTNCTTVDLTDLSTLCPQISWYRYVKNCASVCFMQCWIVWAVENISK